MLSLGHAWLPVYDEQQRVTSQRVCGQCQLAISIFNDFLPGLCDPGAWPNGRA